MAARAPQLRGSSVDSANDEDQLAPFLQSLIQKLRLARSPHGENYYNQSILLKLRSSTSETLLTRFFWSCDVRSSLSGAAAEFDTLQEAHDIMIEAERGIGPLLDSFIRNTLTMDGSLTDVRGYTPG
ncbi:hypothetical protein H9Q74_001033 [Fusarium xylarioides]|nr:hypothetical protein H9Q71_000821 [Fusarium xylarioides]KAG5828891.1 hypothetical protein H9Q74_001033 [Fusarium xylarioides]